MFFNGTWVRLLSSHHFEHFYPVYGPKLQALIHTTCAGNFTDYRAHNATCSPEYLDFKWDIYAADCAGYNLVNCILEQFPESEKTDMASAGIILGLMPVILCMVGSTTAEIALIAFRRPLLAAMLGAASPAVNPMRSADYIKPFEALHRPHKHFKVPAVVTYWPQVNAIVRSTLSQAIVQYGLATLALANLLMVSVDLTRKVVYGNNVNADYGVLAWGGWAIAIHLFGAIALRLYVRHQRYGPSGEKVSLRMQVKDEFTPCNMQSGGMFSLRPMSFLFTCMAWSVSMSTVVHIIYGTQIFASVIFLSGGEGMQVLLRCMASVVLSRMIAVYELNGLGRTVAIEQEEHELDNLSQSGAPQIALALPKPRVTVMETAYSRLNV